jgi:RHS repeat-associated protein
VNTTDKVAYLYDATGVKLAKKPNGDAASCEYYLGDMVLKGLTFGVEYILTPEGKANYGTSGYTYDYCLKDHLGNTRVVFTNVGGEASVLQATNYYPFGMVANQVTNSGGNNQYLYNGKELQGYFSLNWYDYGARMYDGALGRWMVTDPMIEKHYEWTGYSYAYNNPIRFIDIMGLDTTANGETIGADGLTNSQWMESSRPGTSSDVGKQYRWQNMEWSLNSSDSKTESNTVSVASGGDITGVGGLLAPQAQAGPSVVFSYNLSLASVKQTNSFTQWCLFACAASLSKFFGGSTSQSVYANTFYGANGIAANSNTPVSFSGFAGSAMTFSVLAFDQIATLNQISGSLSSGYPVLTRGDFGAGGHAFIITGITGYSDGTASLTYMNPDPSAPAISTMSYQYYVGLQSDPSFAQRVYSITGMKY